MAKLFKNLCFVFAFVLISVSFVSCKKNNNDSGDNSGNESTPAVFAINDNTANDIISDSLIAFENSLDKLNDSEILEDVNPAVGTTTPGLFRYLYNVNLFKEKCVDQKIVLNKLYSYKDEGEQEFNYFKVYNTDNSKLFADYVNKFKGDLQYIGYEYVLNNGNIEVININYFEHEDSLNSTNFAKLSLDIKDSTFEIYSGVILAKNEDYIRENFTRTKIADTSGWSYTYYEKFNFGTTTDYYCNYQLERCVSEVRQNIEDINVAKAYDAASEYKNVSENVISLSKSENYIRHITDNFDLLINFRYENNKLEKM